MSFCGVSTNFLGHSLFIFWVIDLSFMYFCDFSPINDQYFE